MSNKPLLLLDVDGVINLFPSRKNKDCPDVDVRYLKNDQESGDIGWVSEEVYKKWKKAQKRYYSLRFDDDDPLAYPWVSVYMITIRKDIKEILKPLLEVCDVMWASTWMNDANLFISEILGLPKDLPFVKFNNLHGSFSLNLCRKSPEVVAQTEGKSFVWFDDEVQQGDNMFFAEHKKEPAHAFCTDSSQGITTYNVDAALHWLKEKNLTEK